MTRRAPVQQDRCGDLRDGHAHKPPGAMPAGTVSWDEHAEAWESYARRYGRQQSAERMAERGGFSYGELVMFLGRKPTTWEPR